MEIYGRKLSSTRGKGQSCSTTRKGVSWGGGGGDMRSGGYWGSHRLLLKAWKPQDFSEERDDLP